MSNETFLPSQLEHRNLSELPGDAPFGTCRICGCVKQGGDRWNYRRDICAECTERHYRPLYFGHVMSVLRDVIHFLPDAATEPEYSTVKKVAQANAAQLRRKLEVMYLSLDIGDNIERQSETS